MRFNPGITENTYTSNNGYVKGSNNSVVFKEPNEPDGRVNVTTTHLATDYDTLTGTILLSGQFAVDTGTYNLYVGDGQTPGGIAVNSSTQLKYVNIASLTGTFSFSPTDHNKHFIFFGTNLAITGVIISNSSTINDYPDNFEFAATMIATKNMSFSMSSSQLPTGTIAESAGRYSTVVVKRLAPPHTSSSWLFGGDLKLA